MATESILVTGSDGFFGKHLCAMLTEKDYHVYTLKHTTFLNDGGNLINPDHANNIIRNCRGWGANKILHLAGYNGGLQFNLENPYQIFHRNTIMALNVINFAAAWKMEKVVSVVASCAYPEKITESYSGTYSREIMEEQDFLDGLPHDSVACHGYAKRNLFLASKYAHQEFGLNAVCICPTTLYGPGDSFDVSRTKVMGGLIAKFTKAKEQGDNEVQMYGTGAALREFLYVKDAAHLTILSLLKYDDTSMPLNLGSGYEISIKELAEKVVKAVKYTGKIKWGSSKDDGQLRKRLDTQRQKHILGEIPLTSLDEGIQLTVDWYNETRSNSR